MTFALTYRIDLDDMAEKVLPTFPRESVTAAVELYAWFEENNIPLPALQYWTTIAILCLVYAWRDAHPKTRALWKGLEYNAKEAVRNEGVMLTYGRFKFFRQGAWLQIRLPSGRSLCYPHPQIDAEGSLSYAGRDTFTHQWKRIHTYGGKLCENATQSFARDVFTDAGPRMEAAGYDLILPVHDENVTETPDTPEYSSETLAKIMTMPPSWKPDGQDSYAPDLPLAAAGFEGYRYKKED
jgi:DNA polymerase